MKTSLTGIKSTGVPHLGNYLGAIKPAIELSRAEGIDECIYFIADYHALSSVRDKNQFSEGVYSVAATWLALGLDPDKAIFFKQSDVPGEKRHCQNHHKLLAVSSLIQIVLIRSI